MFAAELGAARCEEVRELEGQILSDFMFERSLIAQLLIAFMSDLHGKFNVHGVLLEFSGDYATSRGGIEAISVSRGASEESSSLPPFNDNHFAPVASGLHRLRRLTNLEPNGLVRDSSSQSAAFESASFLLSTPCFQRACSRSSTTPRLKQNSFAVERAC